MRAKLKPIAEQVMIVTGASGGVGLAVARAAAEAGAAVVLVSGDEKSLRQACDDINAAGGRAHPVVGDSSTADGADRISRAATARFGRFDTWIDAGGDGQGLSHAAEAAVRHFRAREGMGALVGFGRFLGRAAREELRRGGGAISATMIRLPRDWRPESPADAVVAAAMHAAARPMGRMALAPGGKRLTVATQAQQHRGLILGVGLVALAATAAWLGRDRIGAAARPRVGRALRPLVFAAAKRRPAQAARLIAKHPRKALKLARTLR
jgi:NAD(P)-dependent dehydrogenase (short-subunit alcohol dehydrogenase family)